MYNMQLIIDALHKRKKNKSADFFLKKLDIIKKHAIVSQETHLVLKELSTCRAMAQYADFSLNEEDYLNNIINESIHILKNAP